MIIQTKNEIINALDEKVSSFNEFIHPMGREEFENAPEGKWSAGQNLDHLIRSVRPLLLAYSLPRFILKTVFGKTNRTSRSYDGLVNKYKEKLGKGGRARGPFIPPVISFNQKQTLLEKYKSYKERLISKVKKYKEEDLDYYVLPHPLLGKITLREMLFFTIHHNEHHLEILQSRNSSSD